MIRWTGPLVATIALCIGLFSCSPSLKDPAKVSGANAVIDLRTWDFDRDGPVIPGDWNWDTGVLWSPETERPESIPPSVTIGGPETGGTLVRSLLQREDTWQTAIATASVTFLVSDRENYALQVGAISGAHRVWANGVLVWKSGIVSTDPSTFRTGGSGTVCEIQPRDGKIEIVYQVATHDYLVLHNEIFRNWMISPATDMVHQDIQERSWRSLQAGLLALVSFTFIGTAILKRRRENFLFFAFFLIACLLKIVFNVEMAQPILFDFLPWGAISTILVVNHGINFLPVPLFTLFLHYQYPNEVTAGRVRWTWIATLAVEVWELLPFGLLFFGAVDAYSFVMRNNWTLPLNIFVVLAVLFFLERLYTIHRNKRPLSSSFFFGGIILGVFLLVPVIGSVFFAVKFSYFLGWGLLFFLLLLAFSLVRGEIRISDDRDRQLDIAIKNNKRFEGFFPPLWVSRLGKKKMEDVNSNDRRKSDAILIRITLEAPVEDWWETVGAAASKRHALLVDFGPLQATWVLEGWAEAALACALEMTREMQKLVSDGFHVVLAKGKSEYRVLQVGVELRPQYLPLPEQKLGSLLESAKKWGAKILFDSVLSEGLVVGGWRAHRRPDLENEDVELFEVDSESQKNLKFQTLTLFEGAQNLYRKGKTDEARSKMLDVIKMNPLDTAARAWLVQWGDDPSHGKKTN